MFSSLSLLVTTSLYLLTVVDAAPSAPSKRQSDNGACQQLTTNCVNAVDKSLNNVFAVESCVLAATCFNGQRPVDNFLAFVSAAKNGNGVAPPQSVNLPRVTSAVMNAISTNAKFISRQNFIDAFYGQLSLTNGPWPSSASIVINYFERVAVWTAFCAGDVPFRNFQDYFQYSASVSSPGCAISSSSVPVTTASPFPSTSVPSTVRPPVTTTPSSVTRPTLSQPVTITPSTIASSGPVTVSTLVPTTSVAVSSGPVTVSTLIPTTSAAASSGPVTVSTLIPTTSAAASSGPVTVSTLIPTTSAATTSGPVTISFPTPSGTVTSSVISLPGTIITSSTVATSGAVTTSIIGGTSSAISASGSVTSSIIGGTSSSISTSGAVTSSSISTSGAVTSSSFTTSGSITSSTLPPTASTTFSTPPPTATPPTLSSDITCQQMLWTCGAQVNSAVTNLWSIKACVLGAACVDGAHPVGTFASAVHSWKMGGSPPTAPVNQPRVSTDLFKASSTDGGKTWSQQNFIDAYYSQLSSTNGPYPPNANNVISYYKRVAAWTGFCGKSIPYMNFADYFQWSATVDGPATTC